MFYHFTRRLANLKQVLWWRELFFVHLRSRFYSDLTKTKAKKFDISSSSLYTFLLMGDDPSHSNLHRLAIDAALCCNWQQALLLNKQLIKLDPDNIDCLNRLAKAYLELGKFQQAKKICQDVLKLDAYNSIAQKNLQKLTTIKKGVSKLINNGASGDIPTVSPALFLEEPGRTKLVPLIKVAEPHKLLSLSCGAEVILTAKNRGITVTFGNLYLGALPDDTAFHLLKLLKGGNRYQAFIKSTRANGITILIRETFRSKKFKNQASFLDESQPSVSRSEQIVISSEREEELDSLVVADLEEGAI